MFFALVVLAANVLAVTMTSTFQNHGGGHLWYVWSYTEPAWLKWPLVLWLAYLVYRVVAGRAKMPVHQAALARWHKTLICKRCGTKFVPE